MGKCLVCETEFDRDDVGLCSQECRTKWATPDTESLTAGTVDEVLTAVSDDPEQAAVVLEAEKAKTKPRVTLIEGLEKVIAEASDDESEEPSDEA